MTCLPLLNTRWREDNVRFRTRTHTLKTKQVAIIVHSTHMVLQTNNTRDFKETFSRQFIVCNIENCYCCFRNVTDRYRYFCWVLIFSSNERALLGISKFDFRFALNLPYLIFSYAVQLLPGGFCSNGSCRHNKWWNAIAIVIVNSSRKLRRRCPIHYSAIFLHF